MDFEKEIKKITKEFNAKIKELKKLAQEKKEEIKCTKCFQDYSWAEIQHADKWGNAKKWFKVGDTRVDYLQLTNEPITTTVMNLEPLELSFRIDGEFEINPETEDENGKRIYWETSKMRNVYMKRIFALLPKEMQDVIAETEITTDLGTCKDKLYLYSRKDIEDKKLDYFKQFGWIDKDRWTWLRSAFSNFAYNFCNVYLNGYIYYSSVYTAYGVRLGFRLNTPSKVGFSA